MRGREGEEVALLSFIYVMPSRITPRSVSNTFRNVLFQLYTDDIHRGASLTRTGDRLAQTGLVYLRLNGRARVPGNRDHFTFTFFYSYFDP